MKVKILRKFAEVYVGYHVLKNFIRNRNLVSLTIEHALQILGSLQRVCNLYSKETLHMVSRHKYL